MAGETEQQDEAIGHSLEAMFKEIKEMVPEYNYHALSYDIIDKLLDALQKKHEEGIFPNLLFPNTVLINKENEIVLADPPLSNERDVMIIGHYARMYSGPEILNSKEATPASDIWSVAVILYKLIKGKHPISDDSNRVVEIKSDREMYEKTKKDIDFSGIPEEVQRVIEKALSFDAKDRYQTAKEFKDSLEKALKDPTIVNYSDQEIVDIGKLELDPGIKGLILNNNQIRDFKGIDHLARLEVLMAESNPIEASALEQILRYKQEGKLPCLCIVKIDGCDIDWSDPRTEKVIVGLRKYDVEIIGADEKEEEKILSKSISINGYRPLKQVGEGGTFDVFLVLDEKNNDFKALLLPREEPINPSSRRMLEVGSDSLLERALFVLRDKLQGLEGIPEFYGEVEVTKDGKKTRGIVEEYISGRTLYTRIKLRQLENLGFGSLETYANTDVISQYFIRILDILQGIHSRGVVHNDFSSNNIIISKRGIYLIDYAVSSSKDADFLVYSSRKYSSPEALRRRKNITSASDIWSVGIILYESIKGKHPIDQNPDEVVKIVSNKKRYKKAKSNIDFEDIHPNIQTIIKRCMSYDPDDRYQTAVELKTGLQEVLPILRHQTAKKIVERYYEQLGIETYVPLLKISEEFRDEYFKILTNKFPNLDPEFVRDLIDGASKPDELNRAVFKLAMNCYGRNR